MLSKTTVTKLG